MHIHNQKDSCPLVTVTLQVTVSGLSQKWYRHVAVGLCVTLCDSQFFRYFLAFEQEERGSGG